MINAADATRLISNHLGEGARARHSVFVGYLMVHFAAELFEDIDLWKVTGLCHDLDFDATVADRSRHGMLTAEWLRDVLPETALLAIQSHDHRTGVVSETRLADALKLADAVAIGELDVGREVVCACLTAADPAEQLMKSLPSRPYLADLILGPAQRLAISPATIAEVCLGAPQQ